MTRKVENQFLLNYAIDSLKETEKNENKIDLIARAAHNNWSVIEEEFVGKYFEYCYFCEDFDFIEIVNKTLAVIPEVSGEGEDKDFLFIKDISEASANFVRDICDAVNKYYRRK